MTEPVRYRMPAEWEPHKATWLAWPHQRGDWPGRFGPIRWVYADIIRRLSRHEPVRILVADEAARDAARRMLHRFGVDQSRVHFRLSPTDRSWIRDYGAIFARDGEGRKVALDWRFNAWAKYDDWRNDDAVPAALAADLGVPAARPTFEGRRVVLEGGAIDVNGAGRMLTTEECLLSEVQCRNPGMARGDYERVFAEYLGATEVIWLGRGVAGDDTHGHVDDIARFVGAGRVVTSVESDPADENYRPLRENLDRLRAVPGLEVIELPMPEPVYYSGRRLPASYANFYIANGLVLVPTFNDPADRRALGLIADLFPGREAVGIHCGDLVWGLGTLHCMTQQEPAD